MPYAPPPLDMNQHNEGPIHLGGDLSTGHQEKSGQTLLDGQRQGTAAKPKSQTGTASSTLTIPGQPGGVVKQRAKRTSRTRLIEALNRANGITKAAQPTASAPSKTPEDITLSASREASTTEGITTIAEATGTKVPGPEAQEPTPQPITAPQNPAPSTPVGWDLSLRMDGRNFSLINRVAFAPSKSAEERRRYKIKNFDPAAFDAAIYQQPAAMKPLAMPAGSRGSPPSSSEDQRKYLHIDPAIHYAHNRSEEWFKAKAQEMESRGGRKAWFGKAIERIRWLRAQAKLEKRLANGHGLPQRRADPQPWKYNRPVDFGDVPESQLPDDVLEDPMWLRFCTYFREVERMRILRQREAKRSKQETQEFYKNVVAGMRSSSGS